MIGQLFSKLCGLVKAEKATTVSGLEAIRISTSWLVRLSEKSFVLFILH